MYADYSPSWQIDAKPKLANRRKVKMLAREDLNDFESLHPPCFTHPLTVYSHISNSLGIEKQRSLQVLLG